jgi:flagellar motor switch protein FliG
MNQSPQPFSFINDENVKRLAGFSVANADKPWLTAMVARYLRQDLAGEWIMALPLQLRVRVALAALNLYELSHEQIAALEADLREFLGRS